MILNIVKFLKNYCVNLMYVQVKDSITKRLKAHLQARDEAIKTKKITLSKRTNELLSNEKEFLKQMLRIRFDREKNIYYII